MGAHPVAPSRLVRRGEPMTLADLIARDAGRELGEAVASRFGARLPFLLKVLAADQPLSLQAHPTQAQARAGFDDEERRAIPLGAPHRNYKDPSHKPELICALTPFDALCGFRRVADTLALFDALGVVSVEPVIAPLRRAPDSTGLAATLPGILSLSKGASARIVSDVVEACAVHRGPFEAECAWAWRIASLYPGDSGVLSALLLNLVRLRPGEAIYMEAGHLHAYLSGVGVEIMASSDNVLRGGLTPKHVDVPELLRVLNFVEGPATVRHARSVDAYEQVWETPAPEFQLSRIQLQGVRIERAMRGPEILLCVDGRVHVDAPDGASPLWLERGQTAFVEWSAGRYTLDGDGAVFRATVGTL